MTPDVRAEEAAREIAERAVWIWCWACFRTYIVLPPADRLESRYGRFMMWLLSYAGAYAHTRDFADFVDMRRTPPPTPTGD